MIQLIYSTDLFYGLMPDRSMTMHKGDCNGGKEIDCNVMYKQDWLQKN